MDNFNLRVFVRILELKSMSAAADEASMTLSGVSMLVNRLERHYRVELVARRGKAIAPTPAGEALYQYAKEAIEAEQRLEDELRFAREGARGWVRIGAIRTVAKQFITPILAEFAACHPDVQVEIESSSVDVLRSLLLGRRLDFACLIGQDHDDLVSTPVHSERILLITEPDDPMAYRGVVAKEEILRRPFTVVDDNIGVRYRVQLENALGCTARSGLIVTGEVADDQQLKEAVRNGRGCGLIRETAVQREIQQGLLREIKVDGVVLTEDICLVRRGQGGLSAAAASLYSAILNSNRLG